MQVQNKESARMFMFRVQNFQGVEVVEYEFKDGKPCVLFGKNGAGKSGNINGIYMAFKGKGGVPVKIDHPVGPYSTSVIKKATVDIGIESEHEILEIGGESLKKLYVHFSITEKGSVSLKVTDAVTGKNTTAPRDKIKQLLGMFVDPVELVKTLEEPNGDRELAEKLAAMVGQDLKPYSDKDEEFFAVLQADKVEKVRQQGQFASFDVPQDDWATIYTDPAEISRQLEAYTRLSQVEDSLKKIDNEIQTSREDAKNFNNSIVEKQKHLDESGEYLFVFKEKNKPGEWKGTENIEEKIQQLTTELSLFREHEKKEQKKKDDIEFKSNALKLDAERLSSSYKELTSKNEFILKKKEEEKELLQLVKGRGERALESLGENKEEVLNAKSEFGLPLPPVEYLKQKMNNVERDNKQVADRKAYKIAEDGIKAVEVSIQDIKKKRKENAAAKSKAVASVKGKFPHPGITVDFKDPNLSERDDIKKKNDITVWVDLDDRRGPRTINDLSEGEQLRICTYILIAGNTGKLNILLVRNGNRLDPDAQHMVYDIANEHGYDIILETIETSEVGALHIVDGKVDSINQSVEDSDKSDKEKPAVETEKENEDKSGFTW